MDIGGKLKNLRKHNNLSQRQLADLLSVKEYSVGDYERGRSEPSIETLRKLSIIFKISLDELLEVDTKEQKQELYNKIYK
ncbi:MAG: helix-turn-helix transcriptional regulator [Clostridia bacterium]|nr:helix-turn-helix transcriptional regulator [Clostridia bacterium]